MEKFRIDHNNKYGFVCMVQCGEHWLGGEFFDASMLQEVIEGATRIGMEFAGYTQKAWYAMHPEANYKTVWAEDTQAGFGKKGWTVYGDNPGLFVHHVTVDENGKYTLHMWADGLREISPAEVEA